MSNIHYDGSPRAQTGITSRFKIRRRSSTRPRAPLTWRQIDDDRLAAAWFFTNRVI